MRTFLLLLGIEAEAGEGGGGGGGGGEGVAYFTVVWKPLRRFHVRTIRYKRSGGGRGRGAGARGF